MFHENASSSPRSHAVATQAPEAAAAAAFDAGAGRGRCAAEKEGAAHGGYAEASEGVPRTRAVVACDQESIEGARGHDDPQLEGKVGKADLWTAISRPRVSMNLLLRSGATSVCLYLTG